MPISVLQKKKKSEVWTFHIWMIWSYDDFIDANMNKPIRKKRLLILTLFNLPHIPKLSRKFWKTFGIVKNWQTKTYNLKRTFISILFVETLRIKFNFKTNSFVFCIQFWFSLSYSKTLNLDEITIFEEPFTEFLAETSLLNFIEWKEHKWSNHFLTSTTNNKNRTVYCYHGGCDVVGGVFLGWVAWLYLLTSIVYRIVGGGFAVVIIVLALSLNQELQHRSPFFSHFVYVWESNFEGIARTHH